MLHSCLFYLQEFISVLISTELLFISLSDISGVNGQVSLHNYPFVVFIELNIKKSYCSGALITPSWVLTAAHCVDEEHDHSIKVYIINTINETYDITKSESIQESPSSFFRVPYSYTLSHKFGMSDIALIKLQKKLDHLLWVKAAPLMPIFRSFSEMTCHAVGFEISTFYNSFHESASEMYLLQYDLVVQRECLNNPDLMKSDLEYRSWICQVDQTFVEDLFAQTGALLFCNDKHSGMSLLGLAAGKLNTVFHPTTEEQENNVNPMVFTDICPYLTWLRLFVGPIIIPSPGRLGSECYLSSHQNAPVLSSCIFNTGICFTILWMCKFYFRL